MNTMSYVFIQGNKEMKSISFSYLTQIVGNSGVEAKALRSMSDSGAAVY
jgi:hypothetical protein